MTGEDFTEGHGRAMYRNVPGSAPSPRKFDGDGRDVAISPERKIDPDEVSDADVVVPTGADHKALAHTLHWLLSARNDDATVTRVRALAVLCGIMTADDAAEKCGLSRSAIDKAISGFRDSAREALNSEKLTE